MKRGYCSDEATPPSEMLCLNCGHSTELTYAAECDLRYGFEVLCPNCGSSEITLLIEDSPSSGADGLRSKDTTSESYDSGPWVDCPVFPNPFCGPAFPDLKRKTLPAPRQDRRICGKCNQEFALSPDHTVIVTCRECRELIEAARGFASSTAVRSHVDGCPECFFLCPACRLNFTNLGLR
jgi:hypothetical protein